MLCIVIGIPYHPSPLSGSYSYYSLAHMCYICKSSLPNYLARCEFTFSIRTVEVFDTHFARIVVEIGGELAADATCGKKKREGERERVNRRCN